MWAVIPKELWAAHGIPEPVQEYQFALPRKWAFDLAWPEHLLAVEIEGGVWTRGRHVRGKGFLADIEKYDEAVIRGWRLLRATPQQVNSGEMFALVRRWFDKWGVTHG
jgi:hypothetical protein